MTRGTAVGGNGRGADTPSTRVVEPMSTENSAAGNTVANDRRIDDGRLSRALTESMSVTEHAPGMYDVTHDDGIYTVDVEGGSCECKDHEYRGDSVVCKHVLRAAILHVYVSGVDSRLVARTVAAADELGCPHGSTGCNGPLALDDIGAIPCAGCCEATPGVWVTWCVLHNNQSRIDLGDANTVGTGRGTDGEPVAMADGGRR